MASEIGDLFVILRAVTEPFTAGLKSAAEEGEVFAAKAEASTGMVGGAFQKLSQVGVVAGAAAALAVGATVKMAGDFQAEMMKLVTQAGVAKDKLAGLSDGVLTLAGQVGFSPTSLAESLYHVESNFESMGISSDKALSLVKIAAEGAATGGANLTDVTNALTAAVASGIPGVQDFQQAMGVLNATVGVGDMQMQDLASAFGSGMVATVKGYGLSIKDVGAALATFGDNNVRGADAGTQLRMSVQALATPIKGSEAALNLLGLRADTLAKDMQKGGLKLALEDLTDRMHKAGISADQQGEIITQAFGRKAGNGLNILVGQMDRLESKYPALDKAAGGFADSWKGAQSTFNQQLKQTEQALVSIGVKLGTILLPYVQKFLGWIQQGIGWLIQHKGAVQLLAGAIGTTLVAAIIAVGGAMASAMGPEMLIAAGIMAVGAAVVYAYNHFKTFHNIVNEIGRFLAGAFAAAWKAAGQVIDWFRTTVLPLVKEAIKAVWDWFGVHKEDFKIAWEVTLHAIEAAAKWFNDNVLSWIRARIAELVAWWHDHSAEIKEIWHGLFVEVSAIVKAFWDGNLKPLLTIIAAVWRTVWDGLKDSFKMVWDEVVNILTFAIHLVENIIGVALDLLTGNWGKAWHDLGKLVSTAMDDVTKFLTDFTRDAIHFLEDAGKNIVKGLINGIKSMASGAVGAVKDIVGGISDLLPHSPAKTGPLSGQGSPELAGAKISTMLADGMTSKVSTVSRASNQLVGAAALSVGPVNGAGALRVGAAGGLGGAGAPTYVVNVTVQGSVLSSRDLRDTLEQQMYQLGMRNSQTWQPYQRR